jgi:hypothetical protein
MAERIESDITKLLDTSKFECLGITPAQGESFYDIEEDKCIVVYENGKKQRVFIDREENVDKSLKLPWCFKHYFEIIV